MDINLLNVLIIEDDPTVADLHKRFVESMEGFRVLAIAASGFKAMEIIKEKEVDVILLDIFLPEMDGIEFLKKIRVEGINAEVIAITAAQEGNIIQEMVHLGVFDYLLKPFSFSRLEETFIKLQGFNKQNLFKDSINQEIIDKILQKNDFVSLNPKLLPKGIQQETLSIIVDAFKDSGYYLSLFDIAKITDLSRVTVKRYINFLEESGFIKEEIYYQQRGRPLRKYILLHNY